MYRNANENMTCLRRFRKKRLHKKTGSYPSNLGELISAGFLQGIPREPCGGKHFIKEDHSIHSSVVKKRMELFID
jgi:hypothetical protein